MLEFIFDFCYLKIKMYFYKHPQNCDGIKSNCVIECSNCVVEKTVFITDFGMLPIFYLIRI